MFDKRVLKGVILHPVTSFIVYTEQPETVRVNFCDKGNAGRHRAFLLPTQILPERGAANGDEQSVGLTRERWGACTTGSRVHSVRRWSPLNKHNPTRCSKLSDIHVVFVCSKNVRKSIFFTKKGIL